MSLSSSLSLSLSLRAKEEHRISSTGSIRVTYHPGRSNMVGTYHSQVPTTLHHAHGPVKVQASLLKVKEREIEKELSSSVTAYTVLAQTCLSTRCIVLRTWRPVQSRFEFRGVLKLIYYYLKIDVKARLRRRYLDGVRQLGPGRYPVLWLTRYASNFPPLTSLHFASYPFSLSPFPFCLHA